MNNMSSMQNQNGKYIGTDSYGPIRIRIEQGHAPTPGYTGPMSPYHEIPHMHIDRRINGTTGRWEPSITLPWDYFK